MSWPAWEVGWRGTGWAHEAEPLLPAVRMQEEYIREQIDWREIAFADNQPCINLISLRPYGILRILDDQCCFPQVSAMLVSLLRFLRSLRVPGLILSRVPS